MDKKEQEMEEDKEKYPNLYLFEKLSEKAKEALNIPKIC